MMLHSLSRYSFFSSPLTIGIAVSKYFMDWASAWILTLFSTKAFSKRGRKEGSISLCTRKVSVALHAALYWTLASTHTLTALSNTADLSTKVWQIPSECPITGILVLSMQYRTNLLEPLGIRRSTYFSAFNNTCTSSLLSIPRIQEEPKEKEEVALFIISTSILLVLDASFPPFRIRPLPLKRERPAICNRASGRASKIMPITPIGKVFFSNTNSGSSSLFSLIFPIGSLRPQRSWYPFFTLLSFSSEKTRR